MNTKEKTPVHLNDPRDWKAVSIIVLVCAVAFFGIVTIIYFGMKTTGTPTDASVRHNNWLNKLPVSKIRFMEPRGDELEVRVNAMLNASRTQMPTGSVELHGNIMWLKRLNAPAPYGIAVQFQDGSGYHIDCMDSECANLDEIAGLLITKVAQDRTTR